MRIGEISRKTGETDIRISLALDGTGRADLNGGTGIGFFDHMLNAFARHGLFDLTVAAKGDLEVDGHHLVEDTGIVLGEAIREAVGDKAGIRRFGYFILPMDEALVLCAIDLSGRPYFAMEFAQGGGAFPGCGGQSGADAFPGYGGQSGAGAFPQRGFRSPMVGGFDTQLVKEFFYSISYSAAMNLHFRILAGENDHHVIEAMFKAFAKALDMATQKDPRIEDVLSTKGVL